MRTLTVSIILLTLVTACTSERAATVTPRTEEPDALEPVAEDAKQPALPPRIFDVDGRLFASGEYVVGIPLPRGTELFRADEVNHVYRIRAPIDKVLAYFGPLMITGNVKRQGKGAVYKRASVRGAEVNPTKVDVSILEVGSNLVRISITELPPPSAYEPPAAQTKAAARDSWRTLD
jgi:hypothetical protein